MENLECFNRNIKLDYLNIINEILNIYNKKYDENIDKLENLHYLLNNQNVCDKTKEYYKQIPLFGKNDRISEFIRLFYEKYDETDKLNLLYLDLVKKIKEKVFSEEEYLVCQRTPNIRIHFPECTNIGKLDTDPDKNVIGLHNDSMFNHPEYEINLMIPLTKMYETNSLYVQKDLNNEDIKNFEPLHLEPGEISFNYLNKYKHFNKINKTGKTRVSFDIRVVPASKYKNSEKLSATGKNKFNTDDYYMKI